MLVIQGSKITDGGLENLSGLVNLRHLDLEGTPISDAGLVHLRGLKRLWELKLADTNVTDAGMDHLTGLSNLHMVELPLGISLEGSWKLHASSPGVNIHRGRWRPRHAPAVGWAGG